MPDSERAQFGPFGATKATTMHPDAAHSGVTAEFDENTSPQDTIASPAAARQDPRPLFESARQRPVQPRRAGKLLATMFVGALLIALVVGGLGRGFAVPIIATGNAETNGTQVPVVIAGGSRSDVGAIVDATKLTPTMPVPIAPVPTVHPTAAPVDLMALRQRITSSEATLHTGQFATTIEYGNGSSASSVIRFTLADSAKLSQLELHSTYKASTGSQTTERIIGGGTVWERRVGAQWRTYEARQDPRAEIASLLPAIGSIPETAISREGSTTLRWHDPQRGTAMTLTVDPNTGVPLTLRQEYDATGQVVSIAYQGWNTPIAIALP